MNPYVFKTLLFAILLSTGITNENSASEKYSNNLLIKPDFFSSDIDEITILPVLDKRKSKDAESEIDFNTDFAKVIRAKISGELIAIKGYKVNNPEFHGTPNIINYSSLDNPSKDWINNLGPEISTHILIVVFYNSEPVDNFLTDKESGAELSAYLFDKNISKLIWKNKYESQDPSLDFMIKSETKAHYGAIFVALSSAVHELMQDFPEKRKAMEPVNNIHSDKDL